MLGNILVLLIVAIISVISIQSIVANGIANTSYVNP